MKKKVLMLGLLSLAFVNSYAIGNYWQLDSLRARAVSNNKTLLMEKQNKVAAHYTHTSATTNFLPKVSATACVHVNKPRVVATERRPEAHIVEHRNRTFGFGARPCSDECTS